MDFRFTNSVCGGTNLLLALSAYLYQDKPCLFKPKAMPHVVSNSGILFSIQAKWILTAVPMAHEIKNPFLLLLIS